MYNHTTSFTNGKLVSFMDSLSPEQRMLFTQLGMAPHVAQTPEGITYMRDEELLSPKVSFYDLKPSVASETEVLVLTALLTASNDRRDLDELGFLRPRPTCPEWRSSGTGSGRGDPGLLGEC